MSERCWDLTPRHRPQTWTVRHAGRATQIAAGDEEAAARVWAWLALDDGDDPAVVRVEQESRRWYYEVERVYDPERDDWYVAARQVSRG